MTTEMNPTLEKVLDRVLARSPAQGRMRRRSGRRLAVLAYHGIDDPDLFATQLDWMARELHPVSLDDVLAAVLLEKPLPDRAVLITFDDGQRNVFDVGLPLLRQRGIPAVVYVVAGLLDTDQPFWWTEVAALSLAGGRVGWWAGPPGVPLVRELKHRPDDDRTAAIDELRLTSPVPSPVVAQLRRHELPQFEAASVAVGNHSLTHACLSRCSPDKIRQEVEGAHRILTDALGHPPRSFAYPDGQVDGRAVRAVQEVGYDLAFLFDHRITDLPVQSPLSVSRLRMNTTNSLDRFAIIASGLHSALHRGIGRR